MLWGCYELLKKLDWVEKMPSRERGHCSLWVLFTAKAGDKTRSSVGARRPYANRSCVPGH